MSKTKILGIDTGTNSLGWAIIERDSEDGSCALIDYGTNIFQEGVKIEKGIESSKAAERREHRGVRRHYWRRKLRKIRLLTILSANGLCPKLTKEELREWREGKSYPSSDDFIKWYRTEDKLNINPYFFRYKCLNNKLNLSCEQDRFILGRALYHINQRRGFKSNRKDSTKESEGKVSKGITELTNEILSEECEYLGEYFYRLYERGEKIRSHYTAREEHYLSEFRAICKKQELPEHLRKLLEEAIFYQRPLKSQKLTVGKCTFEPNKTRCPISHPLFEEFRMYSFINNIKIKTPLDPALRPLAKEEIDAIIPLFYRQSKKTFPFEDIAKKLSGGKKKSYCYYKDKEKMPFQYNYYMDTSVSGCPVNGALASVFGVATDWIKAACEVYTLAEGKGEYEIMNDIWHALYFYEDAEKLQQFAMNRLQLNEEEAKRFSNISVPQEYASLSLKAIRKILPYLKGYGCIYPEAVFLANIDVVIPKSVWIMKETRDSIILKLIDVMRSSEDGLNIKEKLHIFLQDRYGITPEKLELLYHPSMIEKYPEQRISAKGYYQLGSPRIDSVKNPMAMHSLFRLRKVINTLLAEGKIDDKTTINIEFARELNDANRRKAIKSFQNENEKDREACRKKIEELTGGEPSDIDILKYQLWEEQGHKCLYTGKNIGLRDFLGDNPTFDIEHTIPRSVGGDSTKMNLTLCDSKYNREVKKAKLPSQLDSTAQDNINAVISHWKEIYEALEKQLRSLKTSGASDKDMKDSIIQKRHRLSLQRDYWRGKYERFIMLSVPEGFSRRQGTDISVISRYARLYLQSVFKRVFIVKGIVTKDFRELWGLQRDYEKKSRDNHSHHCIDAITIACIGRDEYSKIAQFRYDEEQNKWYGGKRPSFPKPWDTFTEDVKDIEKKLIIVHYTQDNMPKKGSRILSTTKGKVPSAGDAARGPLHLDTYYGAIERDGAVKYVVRKPLDALEKSDIKKIVDEQVKAIVKSACEKHGDLKTAIANNDVWMNKEKGVRIKKVRIFVPSVTRPVNIRQQRDVSKHEYKREYHVMNDRNYMMAIYCGKNDKGKEKREFKLVSLLDAAAHYKRSKTVDSELVPAVSKSGYPLRYQLKVGTMVLLYENNPSEIYEASQEELTRRLYKVIGLSSMVVSGYNYGSVTFRFHQEARISTELKVQNGVYKQDEEYRSVIFMLHTQINCLVEGVDFKISETGRIVFVEKDDKTDIGFQQALFSFIEAESVSD